MQNLKIAYIKKLIDINIMNVVQIKSSSTWFTYLTNNYETLK